MRSDQLISSRFIIALVQSIVCLTMSACADILPSEKPDKSNNLDVIDAAMAEEPSKSPEPTKEVSKSPEPVKGLSSSPEPVAALSKSPEPVKKVSKSREPVKGLSRSPEPV